ncbi:MAG: ribonuclease III [Sneathiella sp.]|nr:ribonuclease III [Sneathiella sp.]
MDQDTKLTSLMKVLGHRFKDMDLLLEALTHSSLVKGTRKSSQSGRDYERLEFLGDRVLGLVISEELFRRYGKAEAGQLSRRYNAQVRKETLASIAEELEIAAYIRMSEDLKASGGDNNPSILEDCIEALIAALYLDGGMTAAHQFIKKNWWNRFEKLDAANKDPKSSLQEWAAKKSIAPPVYEVVSQSGPDHNRTFTVEVTIEGFTKHSAKGFSKRAAEQIAAEKLLKDLLNG